MLMNKEQRLFLIAGTCLLASEIWKQYCLTFVLNDGNYQWWYFPFQLCSVPMYLCLPLGFLGEGRMRDDLLAFLADYTLLSGTIVFLDTSGMYYDYKLLTIHSFLWHFVLILLGIYAGTRKRGRSIRSFKGATAVYLVCCGIAEVINLSCDRLGIINMFYINPHYYMGQLGFRELLRVLPNRAVIAVYILATVFEINSFLEKNDACYKG